MVLYKEPVWLRSLQTGIDKIDKAIPWTAAAWLGVAARHIAAKKPI
jgi:hypothetical protein